jgi:hypothetical protein
VRDANHFDLSFLTQARRCCAIDEQRNTEENLAIFQEKYPAHCSDIETSDASHCVEVISKQRNLMICIYVFNTIVRLIVLALLCQFVRTEYEKKGETNPSTDTSVSLATPND